MSRILIGKSGKHAVYFDLKILRKTRLLITANSGGGKSYLLRLLAELLFPHIQVIIIDPEGEFSTLREKFPYVLVGKGGETEPTAEGVFEHLLKAVTNPQATILKELKSRHPEWMNREELAITLGITMSGSFLNNVSALHSAGMIDYGSGSEKKKVKLADWIFVGQALPA